MSICSYCYKSHITPKHDVSSWWNNSEELVFVCSDDCKNKLKDILKDGKWMTHRPERIFGKKSKKPSPNFGPVSLTDKQFTENT